MEHDAEIMGFVERAQATKRALNEKDSTDTVRNMLRSMAVGDLVRALRERGVRGPQSEAAVLLGVSRTVVYRHVRKERAFLERTPPSDTDTRT